MSLKYRIAVVIFLLEAVMMAFVFSTTVSRSQAINKQQYTTNENVILALLGDLSRFALFTLEYEDLQIYIEKISEDPHVTKLLIVDRNKQIAVSNNVSDVGQEMPPLVDTDSEYWRVQKVRNSSGELGKVAIQFSSSELIQAKKEVLFVGIRVAFIGMSIIAIFGILAGYILTRRLEVLSRAAQRVKDGDLEVQSNLSGNDELAILGQVFDSMTKSFKSTIERLRTRENELSTARDELERRVEERTSELEFANEELEHLATHDPLTGLANRSLFLVKQYQVLSKAQAEQSRFAMIMMDLDRFKEVNDTMGHDVGDELLVQVGARITKILRKTDTVARLGGDEFAIILADVDLDIAVKISRKISACLAEPFDVKNNNFTIGSSQGIAMFPEHASESSDLSKCADIAMYTAKRNQLDHVVYSMDNGNKVVASISLDTTLRQAIDNDELLLQYQPKMDIQSDEIVGVEALVRWQKNGDLVYPDDFIHYAEHTGLTSRLNKWVLDTAMRQHSQWRSIGLTVKISVNVSSKELQDPSVVTYISALLEQYQVEPENLVLEIPEHCIMSNPNRAKQALEKIHSMGIGISIGDFGTGHSSLLYLNNLPVDEIKIDRSFVVDILSNKDSLVMVRSIIGLAHNLDFSVTAAGVEHQEIWELLASLGCNVSQGFYTGRPMDAEELIATMFPQVQQLYFRRTIFQN